MEIITEFKRRESSVWFRSGVVAASAVIVGLLVWFATSPITSHIHLFERKPEFTATIQITDKGFVPNNIQIVPGMLVVFHNATNQDVHFAATNIVGNEIFSDRDGLKPQQDYEVVIKQSIGTLLTVTNLDNTDRTVTLSVEKISVQ